MPSDSADSPPPATAEPSAGDALLDALVEEFTDRLHAGEPLTIDTFVAQHPERGEQLRRLLPWAQAMAQVSRAPTSDDSADADLMLSGRLGDVGDFRLVREIGRGGMGVVYEAEQKSLGRRVALKVLPYAARFDARQLQRFKNEARAVATLDHPHIVAVHTVGFERDLHFYAMQLIEGKNLADVIAAWSVEPRRDEGAANQNGKSPESGRTTGAVASGSEFEGKAAAVHASTTGRPVTSQPVTGDAAHASTSLATRGFTQSFRQIARWGIAAAEALEHAHQLGIVHRDVKPSNLLVNSRGHLWVADFGLAKTGDNSDLTTTGDIPGTLRYMSPEQLRGDRDALDRRTDVYSLGVTLYELLTLKPAFPVTDRAELTKRIVETGVSPPRSLNRAIPHDLEWIILKAAERDPARRYQSAGELVEDLRRFLDDEPVRRRSINLFRVAAARWIRRNPKRVAAAIGGLMVVAMGLSIAGAWRAGDKRPDADSRRALASTPVDGLRQTGGGSSADDEIDDAARQLRDEWQSGTNKFDAGYFDEALGTLARAAESYRRLETNGPTSAPQKLYGALAEANLGRALWKTGRIEESAPHLRNALNGISRQDELQIPNGRDRKNAANVCFQLAQFCCDLLLWEEAADCYRQGIAIAPDSMSVHHEWLYCALATAASGDGQAYRQLTGKVYALYHDDNDPDVRCFFTQMLCAAENPGVDRELVAQIADTPWTAPAAMDGPNRFVWTVHAALAHLDAGHFERAEELASRLGSDPVTFAIFSVIEAHRGRTILAADLLERLEAARRDEARKILLSRPDATGTIDWIRLAKYQNDSARAQRALGAQEVLNNPWMLLVQGRNRAVLQMRDRAERNFREAVETAGDDGDVLMARGRIYLELGWNDLSTRDFQRARDSNPRSPKPLIAQAHALLEQWDASTAESLFEETLSLPSDELDLFLQTDGWWLAGPYPSEIETRSPPETARGPGVLNDPAASPDQPPPPDPDWRRLPSGEFGKIDLGGRLPLEGGCSAYLLTYIYSPEARQIAFRVGSDGPRRVWLNGQSVHTSKEPSIWAFALDQVQLELNLGRNTLLIKVAGAGRDRPPQYVFARLDDSPVDRAKSLVAAHLFPEASDEFERTLRGLGSRDSSTWQLAAYAAAAAGQEERFTRLRDSIWDNDRRLVDDGPYWTARTWLLRPPIPEEKDRWTKLLVRSELDPQYFCPPDNVRIHAALARYRLGRPDEALAQIRDLADDEHPYSWPILSLIHHALGNAGKAAEALERGARWRRDFWKRLIDGPADDFPISWVPLAEFETLYAEACGLIGGRNRADDVWLRLATARERMRFGQAPAAESDLRAAADLAGADPRAWAACGTLLAELGQFERALAGFQSARARSTLAADWHDLARRLARAAGCAEAFGRQAERDLLRQQAIEAVGSAKAAGMKIADQLRAGPELESIRDLPEFKLLTD
jgi:serine/threonine protein kinase/predicted Zn-dependent protease